MSTHLGLCVQMACGYMSAYAVLLSWWSASCLFCNVHLFCLNPSVCLYENDHVNAEEKNGNCHPMMGMQSGLSIHMACGNVYLQRSAWRNALFVQRSGALSGHG